MTYARWRIIPRSCGFLLPVKLADASVSIAVVPPRATSQPVAMANMYEKAAVANASGERRPTMRTDTVCSEFCSAYATTTGSDPLSRIQNSWRTSWVLDACLSSSSYVSPVVHSSCRESGRSDVRSSGVASSCVDLLRKSGSHDRYLFAS